MKRVSVILLLSFVLCLLNAQVIVPQDQLSHIPAYSYNPQTSNTPQAGSSRATYVMLDYFLNEYNEAAQPYYIQWDMNKSYDVFCTPYYDTVGHRTLSWAGVRFDSIFDANTGAVYQSSSITSLQVDSLYVHIAEHTKTTSSTNYLIFKIMSVNTANLNNGYRGLSVSGQTVNNPILWSDTLELNSSLGAGLLTLAYPVKVNGTVGLNLGTAPNGFIAIVEFVGPEADIFRIADMNDFPCGVGSFVSKSRVPDRSLSYINYATYTTSNGCNDLSTVGELSTSATTCNFFYRQNMGVAAGVTIASSFGLAASSSTSMVCPNVAFTLSALPTGGTGNYSYSWTGGPAGTIFSSPSSSSTSVTIPNYNGTATFNVSVTDLGSNTTLNEQVSVSVPGIQVDLPNVTTCSFTSITATVSGNTAGATYTWNPATFPSNNTYNGASAGSTYSVTVTNSSGCSATDQVTVGSNVNLVPTFSASTNLVCPGSEVFFTNTTTNATGWSWEWLLRDTSASGVLYFATTPNTASYTFNTSGTFEVSLRADSGGCSAYSSAYTVTVLPSSDPSCGGGPVSSCPGPATGVSGFRPQYNSLPCMVNNVPYMETIELEVPGSIGGFAAIEYVEIDELRNLPCGISYSFDHADGFYLGGDVACITLMGTPNDVDGQYQLYVEGYYKRDDRSSATYTYDMNDDFDGYNDTSFVYYTRVSPNSSSTCPDVDAVRFWLNETASCTTPRPLNASATLQSYSNSICEGSSMGIEVYAAGGTGSYSYSWSTGATSRVIQVTPANTTTYTVTVTDGSDLVIDTVTVQVIAEVIPLVSLSSSPTALCDGGSFTFTANVINGGNTPYYTWYLNGVEVNPGQQMGASYTSPILTAGTVVTVEVNSSLQCASIRGTSSMIVANCNGPLTATLDKTSVDICPGDDPVSSGDATIGVAANGGSGNYTYSWSPTTGIISRTDQASITVMPAAGSTTNYTVVVSDGSSSVTQNVLVHVFPESQISAGNDVSICGTGTATLSASGAGPNYNYRWSPDEDLSCEYCQYPEADPLQTTIFTVYSRDENGCRGSDDVVVTVASSATASVSIAPENGDELCASTTGQYIDALPVNAGYGGFQWKINGQVVQNGYFDRLWVDSIQVGDEISCLMTSDLSCVVNATATSNVLVVNDCSVVGVLELAKQSIDITVLPNPSNGIFNVSLNGTQGSAVVDVFNIQGALIIEGMVMEHNINIDLSDKADGVYLLRVTTDEGVATRKLIKR